ncbi:MAG: hypothetical protein IJ317_05495 [Clostridia bacterium]|nr:hypothetical protein [Clostridia bacterium]
MAKTKKSGRNQKRKWWFRLMKKMTKRRYKEPQFVYLGERLGTGGILLSNHEGTDGPMTLELYCDKPIRMWGAHEMNSGLIAMYKYQTRVYYHEKKHWNLHLARLFCLIASPITNLFYKGLNLISTYRDSRFLKTIRESVKAIQDGDNVVIYPEVSDKGYLAELEGFHSGFALFADACYRKGIDVPIYVSYFQKSKLVFVVDKPVRWSELIATGATRKEITEKLLERCNELGQMDFSGSETSQTQKSA